MFITFEGGEASGKSTQSRKLATYLIEQGHGVLHTREPGGNPTCEMIRSILLNQKLEPLSEVLLFSASRHEHSKHVIENALKERKVVLCDRFMDSTIAYQGYGLGLDLDFLKLLENRVVTVRPDLTFIIDIDVEIAKERLQKRGYTNHMDERDREFHQKVRFGFLTIAKEDPKRVTVIDGNRSEEEIFHQIQNIISERFQL